jgi:hypothetical protein
VSRSNRVCIETSSCVDGEELKGGQWDDKLNKTIVHRNGQTAARHPGLGELVLGFLDVIFRQRVGTHHQASCLPTATEAMMIERRI